MSKNLWDKVIVAAALYTIYRIWKDVYRSYEKLERL